MIYLPILLLPLECNEAIARYPHTALVARRPKQARTLIADPTHTVIVSAATLWEMRIKQKLGKLKVPGNIMACVKAEEFEWLPVSPEHADATLDLPMLHRDPFDRMLVAQAKYLRLTLLTTDPQLPEYGSFVRHLV